MVIVLYKTHCGPVFLAVFLGCPTFVYPLHVEAVRLYGVEVKMRIGLVLMLQNGDQVGAVPLMQPLDRPLAPLVVAVFWCIVGVRQNAR